MICCTQLDTLWRAFYNHINKNYYSRIEGPWNGFPHRMIFFFGHACGLQKLPGQGLNLHHSSIQSRISDNSGSLACWTTRELLKVIFWLFFLWSGLNYLNADIGPFFDLRITAVPYGSIHLWTVRTPWGEGGWILDPNALRPTGHHIQKVWEIARKGYFNRAWRKMDQAGGYQNC